MLKALKRRYWYGLRVKILAFTIPLLFVVAVSMGSFYSFRTSVLLRENEKKRVLSLAQNLAYNSELGVSAEDADFLGLSIKSILQDQVVRSAAVYNRSGNLIAGIPRNDVLAFLPDQVLMDIHAKGHAISSANDFVEMSGLQDVIVAVYLHTFSEEEEQDSGTEEVFFDRFDSQDSVHREPAGKNKKKKIIGYVRVSYSLQSINAQRNKFLYSGLSISAIVLLCGVMISSIFARRITLPLNQLTNAVKDVGAGKLSFGINVKSQDELGTLAEEFNRMIIGLSEARQKIAEYHKTLEDKVTKRTEELQKAYEELKELDQMKDAFVSSVSHELRTPLTSIRSFSEILLTYTGEDPKTQREFLTIVNSESERLTRLINDVLDLAKIDAGKRIWVFKKNEVALVITKVVQSMQSLLLEKNLELDVHIDEALPQFTIDEDGMLQVLTNLLGNSVKFTKNGGKIQIFAKTMEKKRAEDKTDFIHIFIEDTGIGISPDFLPKVFERFKQVGNTLTEKPKGTGLGLSISKEIVTAHCGQIWAESTQGAGSTFHIAIPVDLPSHAYQKKVHVLENEKMDQADSHQ